VTVLELVAILEKVEHPTHDVLVIDPDDTSNWLDVVDVTEGPDGVMVRTRSSNGARSSHAPSAEAACVTRRHEGRAVCVHALDVGSASCHPKRLAHGGCIALVVLSGRLHPS
jgi:hypothetical protein